MKSLYIKRAHRKITGLAWVVIMLLALPLSTAVAQDNGTGKAAEAPAMEDQAPTEPIGPIETSGIDQAGEKVGRSLDKVGDVAASYLGDWINKKTLADISWLKLLFCLLLLLIVLVFERIVRWILHKKIDTIPQVEGKTSWLQQLLMAFAKPLSL